MIKKKFEYKLVPNGKEICEKQLINLVDKMEKVEVNDVQIEEFLPSISSEARNHEPRRTD